MDRREFIRCGLMGVAAFLVGGRIAKAAPKKSLVDKLIAASNEIYRKTRRGQLNFVYSFESAQHLRSLHSLGFEEELILEMSKALNAEMARVRREQMRRFLGNKITDKSLCRI